MTKATWLSNIFSTDTSHEKKKKKSVFGYLPKRNDLLPTYLQVDIIIITIKKNLLCFIECQVSRLAFKVALRNLWH